MRLSIDCLTSSDKVDKNNKREKKIWGVANCDAPIFYAEKHEKSGERLKKSYKLRYVATKSIYISEKISKFALRTNKFLLIWKI